MQNFRLLFLMKPDEELEGGRSISFGVHPLPQNRTDLDDLTPFIVEQIDEDWGMMDVSGTMTIEEVYNEALKIRTGDEK